MDDLVEREGLYYKKFTDVPFTGKVKGKGNGEIRNGKKEGRWVGYRNPRHDFPPICIVSRLTSS